MEKPRRRVRHESTLRQRLEEYAEQSKRRLSAGDDGIQRYDDLKRIRASEAAVSMIDYLAVRTRR
jgi:hypothetical protein